MSLTQPRDLNQPRDMRSARTKMEVWTTLGLTLVLAFFLITGIIAYRNIEVLRTNSEKIWHTHKVILALDELLATAQDAETGQRGYLLTGNDRYLEPYQSAVTAVATRLEAVRSLTSDNPAQQANLAQLERHVGAKLAELKETVQVRRDIGAQAALAIVTTDRGKVEMDAIRSQLAVMHREENRLRQTRLDEMDSAYGTALVSGVLSSLLGAALTAAVFTLIRRSISARTRQEWLQTGQVGLSATMMGDKSVEELGDAILSFLAGYLGAQAGVLFKGEGGHFYRAAALGIPADADVPARFGVKEGLLGKVAADGQAIIVRDVPDGYLTIGSALGRDKPRHLVIVPALADDLVNAVIELGFLQPIDDRIVALLDQASAPIGIALRSARYRSELQNVLEETQRQAEELQVQSEELRVSNEELEEQGRALKESQTRLEQQQAELEQTNSQLEDQAQILETQRDDLERTSAAVALKARELAQASQYKSDFLANMSHELRTPLNSLLILSKLLGDNPEGNLTDEQVKFAQTIASSGNDLLLLINDILDLSKIEAGHIEVRPESVAITRLTGDLSQLFQPVADERGLNLEVAVVDGCPPLVETDRQRLEQILKNLMSNAFKFTEAGGVRLVIAPAGADNLAFAVSDTGIGIAREQQESIFEAFRQADGTISRKYGGTGLGLSISREFARLLGGVLALESQVGQGSVFTVTIPRVYDPARVAPRQQPSSQEAPPSPAPRARRPAPLVQNRRGTIATSWSAPGGCFSSSRTTIRSRRSCATSPASWASSAWSPIPLRKL